MRKLLLVGIVVVCAGCLSAELREAFEARADLLSADLEQVKLEQSSLQAQLSSGAISQADYQAAMAAISARMAGLEGAKVTLEKEVSQAKGAALASVGDKLTAGAAIAQQGATIAGPWLDVILPGAGYIINLLIGIAGGVGAAFGGRRNVGTATATAA